MNQPLSYKKSLLFCAFFILCGLSAFSQDDYIEENTNARVRLGFHAATNFYRQILLGFQNENATENIDPGYDAINTMDLPNDMYFFCNNTELFIQGVGYFNNQNVYPIGIQTDVEGPVSIALELTENFPTGQTFFLYDAVTNEFFNLKNGAFQVTLAAGTHNNRFSLRFNNLAALGIDSPTIKNAMSVNYINSHNALEVINNTNGTITSEIQLFNMLGQLVKTFEVSNENQQNMIVPVSGFDKGVYIIKVNTTSGTISKKISIR